MGFSEAFSHLYHFCNKLAADPYMERVPIFFFYEDHSSTKHGRMISAKVVLPCSVDSSVRQAYSKEMWTTEKNARKDAAFEAYMALYRAGLVNDNLLPSEVMDAKEDEAFDTIEKRRNLADVDQQINIWTYLAEQWQQTTNIHQCTVSVECTCHLCLKLNMLLPLSLPDVGPFQIYWGANRTHDITVTRSSQQLSVVENVAIAREVTYLIMHSAFQNRMSRQDDFIALYVPLFPASEPAKLKIWHDQNSGHTKIINNEGMQGLIRDISHNKAPYILRGLRRSTHREALILNSEIKGFEQSSDAQCLLLEVQRFPKKINLLHQTTTQDVTVKGQGMSYLLADTCEMDRLPWTMAMFASFVPSILHVIHKTMLVIIHHFTPESSTRLATWVV